MRAQEPPARFIWLTWVDEPPQTAVLTSRAPMLVATPATEQPAWPSSVEPAGQAGGVHAPGTK